MSFKPEIFTTDQVVQHTQEYQKQKKELELKLDQVNKKLETVNNLAAENTNLSEGAKEGIIESVNLFLDEWKKTETLYPEIRLNILVKAADFLGPPADAKPAPGAAPAAAPKK